MKCRICGSNTPKGAKLCKDCAAARKRAFAATVTEPFLLAAVGAPSVDRPRFAPKPSRPKNPQSRSPAIQPLGAAPAPPRPLPAAARTPARRSSPLVWPYVVVAVAGVILAAAIAWVLVGRDHEAAPVDIAPPAPAATSTDVAPPPPLAEAAPATPVFADPGLEMGPPVPPKPARSARRQAVAEPVTAPSPAPAIVVEPSPRPAPPPPRAAEPARIDPVQSLNEALARCGALELFSRPACEQRARDQFCGNAWGQIPQCPIGRGNDHGQ